MEYYLIFALVFATISYIQWIIKPRIRAIRELQAKVSKIESITFHLIMGVLWYAAFALLSWVFVVALFDTQKMEEMEERLYKKQKEIFSK